MKLQRKCKEKDMRVNVTIAQQLCKDINVEDNKVMILSVIC